MYYRYIVIILLSYILSVSSQNFKIQGEIHDLNSNEPIANVNIYLSDLSIGTISDNQGKFIINISNTKSNSKLIFEHIGFDTLVLDFNNIEDDQIFYLKPKQTKI